MAGSIDWFNYVDETGVAYAVRVDKSNGLATVGGELLMNPRAGNAIGIPCIIKKRYVNAYSAANPRIKRRFYIGNLAAINAVTVGTQDIIAEDYPAGDDAPGQARNWVVTSYRGEKVTKVPPAGSPDTGLTDSGAA